MAIADKNREFQLIKAAAVEQKWRVEPTGRGHYLFKSPNGRDTITAGGSYKDPTSIKNLVSRLRRAGFQYNKG